MNSSSPFVRDASATRFSPSTSSAIGIRSPAPLALDNRAGSSLPLCISAVPEDCDLELLSEDRVAKESAAIVHLLQQSEQQHAHVVGSLVSELERSLKEAAFCRAQTSDVRAEVLVLTKERDDLARALGDERRRSEELARRIEEHEGNALTCSRQIGLKEQQIAALHAELSRMVLELDRCRLEAQRINRNGVVLAQQQPNSQQTVQASASAGLHSNSRSSLTAVGDPAAMSSLVPSSPSFTPSQKLFGTL